MAIDIKTTKLFDYLSSEYNLSSKISAFAYKSEISASEICGYTDTKYSVYGSGLKTDSTSTVISIDYDELCSRIDISSYLKTTDTKDKLALSSIDDLDLKDLAHKDESDISSHYLPSGNSYLTSNALDNLSGNWQGTYGTVSCLSGKWISAWSRVSALTSDILSDTIAVSSATQVEDFVLSNSSRVYIKDETKYEEEYKKSDLSVLKLPLSSYELSVIGGTISDNVLYITDSDYMDMYRCQICALTMPEEDGQVYEGVAATKTYVDTKILDFKDKIVKTTSRISSIILNKEMDNISIENIAEALSVLCKELNELD